MSAMIVRSSFAALAALLVLLLVLALQPQPTQGVPGQNDSIPGQVNQVAVDMDTTGNPTGSGGLLSSIQSSAVVPVGNTLDIDVVVDEIDPVDGLAGFYFNLKFNPSVLQITSKDVNSFMLTGAITCCSDPIPNATGNVFVEAGWIGGSASGEGVLTRLTIECLAPGLSALDLSNDIDQTGIPRMADSVVFGFLDVLNTLDGQIFCGSPLPTATLTVNKDFSDNNTDAVEVIVTCGLGATHDHPFSKYVTEVTPVDFTISVPVGPETCDVVESPAPAGYAVDDSNCQNVIVSSGSTPSCTIINTLVDGDGDGVPDATDNCPATPNPGQEDTVHPGGPGDACDDPDADGVFDDVDNCPSVFNPDQADTDAQDGGDLCDICPNDPTDTCDTDKSAAAIIDSGGGTLATPDGSATITIPAGALPADTTISVTGGTSTDFELTTNLGQTIGVFAVDIQPEGLTFSQPITLVFAWDDANDDGTVDGMNVHEDNILISKDSVAITDRCRFEAGCDTDANTFTFTVSSLSVFVPAAPADSDGDGFFDNFDGEVDNCQTTATDWFVNPGDTDCDGFADTITYSQRASETFVGTDPNDSCADTATLNDERGPAFGEPLSPWVTDTNDDGKTTLGDVLGVGPYFNSANPDSNYWARFDWNGDGKVGLSDMLAVSPFFNKVCVP